MQHLLSDFFTLFYELRLSVEYYCHCSWTYALPYTNDERHIHISAIVKYRLLQLHIICRSWYTPHAVTGIST